jgi:hypothetical protein
MKRYYPCYSIQPPLSRPELHKQCRLKKMRCKLAEKHMIKGVCVHFNVMIYQAGNVMKAELKFYG